MIGRAALLLTVALLGGGCDVLGIDSGVEEDLKDEKEAWLAQNHRNYTYEFLRSCFCGEVRRVVITVRNDDVTSVVVKETGEPVTQFLDSYMTITDLYDYLIDVADGAAEMQVAFDNAVHIPIAVSADPIRNAVDDEFGMTLGNFTVISP
jgi:hypothetical protein